MFIKLMIVSVIVVAVFMLAIGLKKLINPKAKFPPQSCALEENQNLDKDGACSLCQLKDLANCPENKGN